MTSPEDVPPLHTLFAPSEFVTEHVFTTKSGELGVLLQLEGIDAECLTDEMLEDQHRQLVAAERPFDEQFTTYQYLVKLDGADVPESAVHPNPVIQETVRSRLDFLQTQSGLASISLYRVILYHPKRKKDAQKNAAFLRSTIRALMESANYLLGAVLLTKMETFGFFRFLACLDPAIARERRLVYDNYVDYWMCSVAPQCQDDGTMLGREVLTLQELPRNTWANTLADLLKIRGNFVLCSEYRKLHTEKVVSIINQKQQHFDAARYVKSIPSLIQMILSRGKTDWIVPDESAAGDVTDLSVTIKQVNNAGDAVGYYSLTAVFFDKDPARSEAAATQAIKVFGDREGSLARETYWAFGAYLSIIPGTLPKKMKMDFRQRRRLLPASQHVDLSFVYGHRKGEKVNKHLGKEYLLLLETTDRTPYFFNLHESDLLGVLIFGIMGSGKSFTTNLFIDHSQKYRPFTFILDIGGSYREITRKHGGEYIALSERKGGFAPFGLERNENNIEFLSSFVHVLLETTGYKATPQDSRHIDRAVRSAERLSDLDIPANLKDQLYNWTGNGRYAYLFDNKADTLEIADFQAFDFQGVRKNVLGPLFFYIFQRISEVVYDPRNLRRFKQLWCDEPWKFVEDAPTAQGDVTEAGKTWRKHNGGIGLTTQSAHDYRANGFLERINEICPTKILLANPGANRQFYREAFDLNEKEIELFASLLPKKQILVKTPTYSKVLNVNVDELAKLYYSNDPQTNIARLKAQQEHGLDEGLKVLAKGA